MLIRKIRQIKESRVIAIPAHICDGVGINAGDRFRIELVNEKIILTPAPAAKQETGAVTPG